MCSFYRLFFIQYIPGFQLSGVLSSLEKCPGRRRVEEKDFHSVIQRHRVNASILFLTTSVNCRSDSPTHSTFLLEGEAETLRLKWDEECSKRCCSCPFLTPSPPLISPFHWELVQRRWHVLMHIYRDMRGTQTQHVTRLKHFINSGSHCGKSAITTSSYPWLNDTGWNLIVLLSNLCVFA